MSTYLGQNFLVDTKVKTYIADKIKQIYEDNNLNCIIEIGPGKGAITKKIYNISDNFFVIEKDETMKDHLEGILDKAQIIFTDVLESDIDKELKKRNIDPTSTLIIGNLPYYITSPIFRKFFGNGDQKYFGGFFMIQDEVGQKIQTEQNKKSFLRWLLNYAYHIEYKKTVGAKCFKPAPKVKSCLVQFQEKENKIDIDFQKLFEFLNLYSQFSRKTLGAIDKILQKQNKDTFKIPENLKKKRLEELSWENIKKIINQ
ncbi:MAG TPA: rRNA adenine dimethyltransferase family protein [Candidatus Absconditabacterales bacterium]|nr:rRNA adenine dimethyltransferase family protein [Candidatus Absconditabacterales bacterium]